MNGTRSRISGRTTLWRRLVTLMRPQPGRHAEPNRQPNKLNTGPRPYPHNLFRWTR